MMEMVSPQGGKIIVYDRERCICDIHLAKHFASKERDNIRLMEYARKFHIEEKVQEYMEIL